jgi:hypothetical protein
MSALAVKALCALVLVMGALAIAYKLGASRTAADYELRLQAEQARSAEALVRAERDARGKENAAKEALYALSARHLEEEKNAKHEIDGLRADLRAARVRLSIPVASAVGAAAGADSAAAAGAGAEARAELVPAVADDLVGIAADGDAAVRQLNRVIDAYNAVSAAYNELAEKIAALDRS